MKNIKLFIAFSLGILVSSVTVFAANYLSNEIGYSNSKNPNILSVKDAIDDLYTKVFDVNNIELNTINGITSLNVTSGKNYLIVFNVTSSYSQDYKPSIVSGANILTNKNVKVNGSNFHGYMYSYLVKATSDKIDISGNTTSPIWNFVTYIEIPS